MIDNLTQKQKAFAVIGCTLILVTSIAICKLLANEKTTHTKVTPLPPQNTALVVINDKKNTEKSEPEKAETPSKYSKKDVELIAKTVWGEARGCSKEEWRLVIWTILQRVDSEATWWGNTIEEVIKSKGQFIGYHETNPLSPEITQVTIDVLEDWEAGNNPDIHEKYAPTTPYYYFNGDGKNNYFRKDYKR